MSNLCKLCLQCQQEFGDSLMGEMHGTINQLLAFSINSVEESTAVCSNCNLTVNNFNTFYRQLKSAQETYPDKSSDSVLQPTNDFNLLQIKEAILTIENDQKNNATEISEVKPEYLNQESFSGHSSTSLGVSFASSGSVTGAVLKLEEPNKNVKKLLDLSSSISVPFFVQKFNLGREIFDEKFNLWEDKRFCSLFSFSKRETGRHKVNAIHQGNLLKECGHSEINQSGLINKNKHSRFVRHFGKPFKCQECDYSSHLKSLLNLHVRVKHIREQMRLRQGLDINMEEKRTCAFCTKTFNSESRYNVHCKRLHPGKL